MTKKRNKSNSWVVTDSIAEEINGEEIIRIVGNETFSGEVICEVNLPDRKRALFVPFKFIKED